MSIVKAKSIFYFDLVDFKFIYQNAEIGKDAKLII